MVIRRDNEVGHKKEHRHQDRHVDVRDPIPVVEQRGPDAAHGRLLQRPCLNRRWRRFPVRPAEVFRLLTAGTRMCVPGVGSHGAPAGKSAPKDRAARGRPYADAVAVPNERTHLDDGKSIQVGSNFGRLPLDFGGRSGRVFVLLDDIGHAREDEAGSVLERFIFQLPNPIHEDVGGAQGGADQSAGAAIHLHLERLADVADDDAIEPAIEPAETGVARRLPVGRFEQVPIEPELIVQFECPVVRPFAR